MVRHWAQRVATITVLVLAVAATGCTAPSAPPATQAATSKPAATAAPAAKPAATEAAPAKPAATTAPAAKPAATAAPLPATITMASYQTGSAYYQMANGLSKIITDKTPMKVVLQSYPGPLAFIPGMNKGEIHLGTMNLPYAAWAYTQGPGMQEKYTNLRLLFRGNFVDPMLGIVVREDAGIKQVEDLRGKRVASEYGAMNAAAVWIEIWLASGGLTWKEVRQVPTPDINSGLKALREGRVDAVYAGGADSPYVVETDAAVKLIPVPFGTNPQGEKLMRELMPGGEKRTGAAGAGILRSPVQTAGQPTTLVAGTSLSDEAGYQLVKALWENHKELQTLHAWLRTWEPNLMFTPDPPIPYHAGAVRFFKEQQGVWSDAVDARHKKLLADGGATS